MNVFVWHVHGSWMTAFVHGPHRYLVPVLPDRGPDGRGRARTYEWPEGAVEIGPHDAATCDVDVVVLQRPEELHELAPRWLGGRVPGRDIPAVYVEHNAPQGRIADMNHVTSDRPDLVLAHVTHFNALFWDSGSTPTTVVEHGILDPGYRYTGELARAAAVITGAGGRGRVTGTDLLERFERVAPVDLFGIDAGALGGLDLPQEKLHAEMARRRVYVHPFRWTSLGLSLLEAMHLGMPVVALATTEAPEAIPAEVGIVSTRVEALVDGVKTLLEDRDAAVAMGMRAREHARRRYGLSRFLRRWDDLLMEVTR
jgi:glycosyltransferase involved in cell wall biosynthesis